jgi:SAM-dependent methyltransferase
MRSGILAAQPCVYDAGFRDGATLAALGMTIDERNEREIWDRHWQSLQEGESSFFGKLASLVRRSILCRAVRAYTDRYFPEGGVFVEAGCGTGESSSTVRALGRRLVGLDFSLPVLEVARAKGATPYQAFLRADIHALPFRDDSLAGIWNLGVMEHFPPEEGQAILRELLRVLRPGACVLLFWPPEFGSSRLALAPIEWVRSRTKGEPFHFFPDEVNRLRSFRHARETLIEAGFEPEAVDFTPRDAFIHVVAVGRKSEA